MSVVKVDIEGGPELKIVESIAHIPELSELVDEMYFEYHFNFSDVPNHPWDSKPKQYGGDLALKVRVILGGPVSRCLFVCPDPERGSL